jgi:peptide subunit release factor 1 (eRF1)
VVTTQDLKELAVVECATPVLSVYLNVDPREHTSEEYRLELRRLLKGTGLAADAEDALAVERYFDHEYDWSGRGVVVFSCAAEPFWRTITLAVPVASGATVASKPYVWPLAALLDAYGSYAVALVDRQEMRLFHFAMGELVGDTVFAGDEVRRLKKGRGSSGGPGRRGGAPVSGRHEEEIAQRNIRDAAKVAARFWRQHDPQRLIVAGAEPTVGQFRDELPKSVQERIIGSFSADMASPEIEIRERSLEILQQVEDQRKSALVDAVFTAAAKGRGGAIRLADTLGAAHEGRIQTLIVARDYHRPGYRCRNCAYITDQRLEGCPFCGSDIVEISDAAEALVTRVIEDGGRVEVIDDHPRIAEFGVGALLRY